MKFKNIESDVELLYYKAKKSFEKCIYDDDNEFLNNEVNIPLEDIIIIEKDIKIVFSQRVYEVYLFEVSLLLFAGDKEIGKYFYIENESGVGIEDNLLFY